jgi:hypothetical protein
MSQSATRYQKAKSHQGLINALREDDCMCRGVTLCPTCDERVGQIYTVSHEDYEEVCRMLDAGNSYE